ncbi:hypothetical protein CJO81_08655 [Ralstonia solanacearum]|uniref:Uncharacterized protein n=2 Tax=Ralstonia solanacearum species complex TaxID=3116862 RepID=A0A454TUU0_9RALS|nr:hypothetical protein CJO74_10275 [Ralstonia solanacearum]RNM08700.1 hypothetical protein EGA29_07405 [Ralstonia pseudosolanacearum]AXV95595.1 hypothetical protein CJO80_08340 [Ralstonia solanacearum]AXW00833.1 hypothetical protein CJO81_08655 [Ralstonia solanacearum]AXW28322.1 hypothetical protein CJO87_08655 [Ralstonia solanacearum]
MRFAGRKTMSLYRAGGSGIRACPFHTVPPPDEPAPPGIPPDLPSPDEVPPPVEPPEAEMVYRA